MALTDFTSRNACVDVRPVAPRFSLLTAISVWRSRRALARLDAHALADVGITAACAVKEAAKPIWDVPATWRN